MIVVLGRPGLGHDGTGTPRLHGLAARIASAAAAQAARVELVGSVGDDPEGDLVVVALGHAGVGHAALLRDAAGVTPGETPRGTLQRLDAADVDLGLRYVSECRVLVVADQLDEAAARVAAEAAGFHGAALVVLVPAGAAVADGFGASVTALEVPAIEDAGAADQEPDAQAAFVTLVAGYAVALDAGRPAAEAFEGAMAEAGWERASGD